MNIEDYYREEIMRIMDDPKEDYSIVITGGKGKTKFMNLNEASLPVIIEVFTNLLEAIS